MKFFKRYGRTVSYLLLTDWLILIGSFGLALYFRNYSPGLNIISRHHIIPEALFAGCYALVCLSVFNSIGLYKRKVWLSSLTHAIEILKAVCIVILAYLLAKAIFKSPLLIPSRWVILLWSIFLLTALWAHRLLLFPRLLRLAARRGLKRRVVLIGDTEVARFFLKTPHPTLEIIGLITAKESPEIITSIPHLGAPADLPDLVKPHDIEGAVICNPTLTHQELIDLAETCIRLFGWVDIHSERTDALHRVQAVDAYFDIPFIRLRDVPDNPLYYAWKRSFDFTAALGGILLLSPLLLATALAVKLTSPGPVLYTRDRIGKDGNPFKFYKFRSMAVGADQDTGRAAAIAGHIKSGNEVAHKVINTAYITPVGKFIRKWAIDELPQLFNVLKGDMALVGPRPLPPEEYDLNEEWQRLRFHIRPGCAGLWKIQAARKGISFNDTALYDLYYTRHMNPVLDLYLIAMTVWVILAGRADG